MQMQDIPYLTEYEVSPQLWGDLQNASEWLRERHRGSVTGLWVILSSDDTNGRRAFVRLSQELPSGDRFDLHGNIPLRLIDLWEIVGNDTGDIDVMLGELFSERSLRCVFDDLR